MTIRGTAMRSTQNSPSLLWLFIVFIVSFWYYPQIPGYFFLLCVCGGGLFWFTCVFILKFSSSCGFLCFYFPPLFYDNHLFCFCPFQCLIEFWQSYCYYAPWCVLIVSNPRHISEFSTLFACGSLLSVTLVVFWIWFSLLRFLPPRCSSFY